MIFLLVQVIHKFPKKPGLLSLTLNNCLSHHPQKIASGIVPLICVRSYSFMDTMFPPFVDLDYFRLHDVGQTIINGYRLLLLPCSLIPFLPPKDIWGPLFFIYWIFVAPFDAADVMENMSMVTINRNQGQATTTNSTDTCKMTRDLNVYQKLVVYRFPLLIIHIYLENVIYT